MTLGATRKIASAVSVRNVCKEFKRWHSPLARLAGLAADGINAGAAAGSPLRRVSHRHAAKLFTGFHALTDVSFEVARGESLGIVGMNGSGKSTLLQLIVGVMAPTSGTVKRDGRVAALLELGSGFNPEFTGRENVYLNASILGLSNAQITQRLPQIAAFAELGDFLDQPTKTYSSGMMLRLAFGVMTQVDPQILIVDEALAVGDAYFQYKCITHIRNFRDRGGSLLFVSHDASAVKTLCSRAILLDCGRIVREGPPDAVMDYYNALIARKERDAAIEQVKAEGGRYRTRSGNGLATIENVALLDSAGAELRSFPAGADAFIRITVEAHADLNAPTIGMGIHDRLGNDVFGTNLTLLGEGATEWKTGDIIQAEFKVRLNLCEGTYSLSATAHSAHTHLESNYDWIDHAIIFTVKSETIRMTGCAALPVEATVQSCRAEVAA